MDGRKNCTALKERMFRLATVIGRGRCILPKETYFIYSLRATP